MQFGMRKNCTANNLFVKTIFISDDNRVLFLKRLRRNDRDGRSIELGDMYFYYPLYLGYQAFISGTLERWWWTERGRRASGGVHKRWEEWTDVGHWALLIVIASSGHSLTSHTEAAVKCIFIHPWECLRSSWSAITITETLSVADELESQFRWRSPWSAHLGRAMCVELNYYGQVKAATPVPVVLHPMDSIQSCADGCDVIQGA